MTDIYAHSLEERPTDEWEPLEAHLLRVADLAEQFAHKFEAGDWGRLLGLWHDLGKYSTKFQTYLRQQNGFEAHLEAVSRVAHSTAGAKHAVAALGTVGRLLAYCIAGHHAGLTDWLTKHGQSGLSDRLARKVCPFDAAPAHLLQAPALPNPKLSFDPTEERRFAYQLSLFVRMLFSCLVDADYLATETFMSPDRASQRPAKTPSIVELRRHLDEHLDQLSKPEGNNVARSRREVLTSCRDAATHEPGLFSLTVPTGGGKTLSSLAFALRHAEQHGFERVIYAIPFTSIVEQTADVFRRVFELLGTDIVLEHHSNFDPQRETIQSRLASENWDAPLIVTTNVQFFESLFAARTSTSRKLHRIARSVVILDEAQTLPVDYLKPCLSVLRELTTDYRSSIVLCTATQPALQQRDDFPIGLNHIREIMPHPVELARRMKRVDVQFAGVRSDDEIATELRSHRQFLCIVNTRPHASRLFEKLQAQHDAPASLFHLSTRMCGQHRAVILKKIRRRLATGQPCGVVSTQLIEAGVDVDFPIVYRALTGIDSIAQAAGRCNREGKQSTGIVHVFEPADVKLRGYLASVAASASEIIPHAADILAPETIEQYFRLHYWKQSDRWDAHQIMDCFPRPPGEFKFYFRRAADAFRFIQDETRTVFVPYGRRGERLVKQLRKYGPSRALLRKLQRYTIGLYERDYYAFLGTDIQELHEGYPVLINMSCYDQNLGFRIDRKGYHEDETLIL